MKLQVVLGLIAVMVGAASCQFLPVVQHNAFSFPDAHPQFQHNFGQDISFPPTALDQSKRALAHRAVVINSEAEARLPPSLQNPFYKNPRIQAALAKESWFTPGEQQVREREAEKIPRQKIYSILKNAGLVRRR